LGGWRGLGPGTPSKNARVCSSPVGRAQSSGSRRCMMALSSPLPRLPAPTDPFKKNPVWTGARPRKGAESLKIRSTFKVPPYYGELAWCGKSRDIVFFRRRERLYYARPELGFADPPVLSAQNRRPPSSRLCLPSISRITALILVEGDSPKRSGKTSAEIPPKATRGPTSRNVPTVEPTRVGPAGPYLRDPEFGVIELQSNPGPSYTSPDGSTGPDGIVRAMAFLTAVASIRTEDLRATTEQECPSIYATFYKALSPRQAATKRRRPGLPSMV